MTVQERVLASRLIEKLQGQSNYAKQIGLTYTMTADKVQAGNKRCIIDM